MTRDRNTETVWTRAEPGTRQPRLSRQKIAEATVRLADAEGFEAVSMRRVARELGGSTMSLYYYVKTRAELMALMDDALMGELLLPSVSKGPRALLEIALATADMLRRHPWALVAMRGAPPGPNALRHTEQCLETLAESELSSKEKLTLLAMIDDYVFGYALREAEAHTGHDEALARKLLATGDFPRLEQVFRRGRIDPDPKRLRRALEALIDSVLTQ
ncbi:MAG TPA: TetR/AcrR family transcriptional regulator C-terminal domain-containing protein [Polyangiales bacterium]|nr:TetR/AcrR family transcriptional regulator C-terminal domain-containing protein [Polyangiales bacterium]